VAAAAVSTRTPAMRSRMSQRVVHSVGSNINMVYGLWLMGDFDQQLVCVATAWLVALQLGMWLGKESPRPISGLLRAYGAPSGWSGLEDGL
jgi:hypothetical protein